MLNALVSYDLVLTGPAFHREEHVGEWQMDWEIAPAGEAKVNRWWSAGETRSRAARPVFVDISERALGRNASYSEQLRLGTDYWRTVLDAACGIDIYGNNGVAVGDIDNDGFDEIYVCQAAGLPNRLYKNLGDGTFEDVTERAGVGVLDDTACALFVDIDNDGHQDLVVVRAAGPLLFLNDGSGRFHLKPDAFRFAQHPQIEITRKGMMR